MADKSDAGFVGLQQFVDLVREDNTKVNHPTRKIQAIGAFASHQEASTEAHPYRTQAGYLLLALGKWKR